MTSIQLPYYRGSSSERAYTLPYPYLIYRGDYFNIDEDGIRGWLYRTDDLALDLSLAGGVPVPSDQNGSRAGMPDLDPTIEFGPSLEYRFWRSKKIRHALWLRLPLRSAFSISTSNISHQGWVFAPYLEYTMEDFYKTGWRNGISIGPIYADDAYHDYFYAVAPEYATPSRPAYQATSGYSGSRLTLVVRKQWKDLWLAGFARVDTLNQATFEDSPLVATKRYHIVGVALTWIFSRSETMVHVP